MARARVLVFAAAIVAAAGLQVQNESALAAPPPPEEVRGASEADAWPEEDSCKLFSKRGLELSCDVHPRVPTGGVKYLTRQGAPDERKDTEAIDEKDGMKLSMSHYVKEIRAHGDGATVYVTTSALPAFVQDVLPNVTTTFKLVTGDAIMGPVEALTSHGFEKLAGDSRVIKWFAQNCANGEDDHPKVVPIPVGLDYHTLKLKSTYWGPQASPQIQEESLTRTFSEAPAFDQRSQRIYYCGSSSSKNRSYIVNLLMRQPTMVESDKVGMSRQKFWERTAQHRFVASPPGAGIDCHRTYEIFALGGIPLVSRRLHKLYDDNGFNVVQLGPEDWGNLAGPTVQGKMRDAMARRSDTLPPAMYLKYWVDKVKA